VPRIWRVFAKYVWYILAHQPRVVNRTSMHVSEGMGPYRGCLPLRIGVRIQCGFAKIIVFVGVWNDQLCTANHNLQLWQLQES